MKAIRVLSLTAILATSFLAMGCETSHSETDKQGMFGGTTHEETTTTHNPITNTDDKTQTEIKTN
jgi:hypothetical protein